MVLVLMLVEACLLGAGAVWLLRRSAARRGAELAGLTDEAAELCAQMRAQAGLEENIGALRTALYARGAPALRGGELCFGPTSVHGELRIVDEVKARHGGVATIFCGDERVATNVVGADGRRAVGTKLAAGPARTALFTAKTAYHGEVEILGSKYLGIYEPVLAQGEVIGVLFAGCAKVPARPAAVAGFAAALAGLGAAFRDIAATSQGALAQRHHAEDARRVQEDAQRSAALAQRAAMRALGTALQALAGGDLTYRITAALDRDYEGLRRDFNETFARLAGLLTAVTGNAAEVAGSAGEIRQASDDLARRTEQQAATLEETAAALGEITGSVAETAGEVERMRALAEAARTQAEHSAGVLGETVTAMQGIETAASQIGAIIGVIDGITFQTNLLALNAGVEAARAGEAGRGFAVVATEIRNLAQRSAEAAKEIRALITDSATRVETGVKLVHDTAGLMQAITAQVQRIEHSVRLVAEKAAGQASGLHQISDAVGQMDKVTQQNAAMVEQTTASTHNLSFEAQRLQELLGGFRLQPASAPAPALAPAPAPALAG